jgi:hypothetical protein
MARIAVFDPDDDPARRAWFAPPAGERQALFASLLGQRLEVREADGQLLARIRSPRLDAALDWLRRRLGPPA